MATALSLTGYQRSADDQNIERQRPWIPSRTERLNHYLHGVQCSEERRDFGLGKTGTEDLSSTLTTAEHLRGVAIADFRADEIK